MKSLLIILFSKTEAEVEKIMEVEGLKPIPVIQDQRELRGGTDLHKSHSENKQNYEHRAHQEHNKSHQENRGNQENRVAPEQKSYPEQKSHQHAPVQIEQKTQAEDKPETHTVNKKEEELGQKPKTINREDKQVPRTHTGNHPRNNDVSTIF
jgi:hypothetical protein